MSAEDAENGEGPDDIGYAEAIRELDTILDSLDRDTIDVDDLARQVRRAATLIQVCRTRIDRARFEVEQVVADLTPEVDLREGAGDGETGGEDDGA